MKHQVRNSEFHLSPSELRALIEAAPNLRDSLIVRLFVYTGIRRAELQNLRWEDVDLGRRRILVRWGKGGKQRILFLPDSLLQEVERYRQTHNSPYLFPGPTGSPMSLRNINYIIARVGERANLTTPNPRYRNISPHLLRHSFARNWKRAGGSLESLQKILGHSSLKTTLDIYGTEGQAETEENYRELVQSLVAATPVSHS